MQRRRDLLPPLGALAAAAALAAAPRPARAQSTERQQINESVQEAVRDLRQLNNMPQLFQRARAILVFPRIVSGGFIVGGQYGEGALLQGNAIRGYYSIAGASFGLLAGVQRAGLAMFFMNEEAIQALMAADGWEIGTGPTVAVLDRGVQANFTATTLREEVYAVTFNQEGLMASIALNGTKISRIER